MKSFNINRQLITSTMKPNKEIEETAAAEGVFVYHGGKHGHSYLSQQCITNVLKTIFSSSSAISKSMSCGRTKCNSIAVNVLAPYFTQKVLTEVKQAYFYSIMFDASNKGNTKFFPVCVQYFSKIGVKKGIIDLIDDADESATNIFENLMTVIKKSGLPFDGLTSIGADNTNVNMGNNHSVYTLFNNEIENLFKGNCYCHILHNGVKWGHQQLTVDIEKFLVMTYAHFSHSAKRVEELKSYHEFYEQDFHVLLKHIKIRWLSLYSSIERLLLVYKPVKSYFSDQLNKEIPKELENHFQSEETLCVLSFLHHVLFEIQKTNLELQKECITAIDSYRIITSLQYKLKQRLNTGFFGIHCRQMLDRIPSDTSIELQASFVRFISTFLEYADKYFSQNVAILEAIGHFGNGIENLTWSRIQKCIELTKIEGLNEDNLFNEFTELKLTFEIIKKKQVPLFDQIQFFLSNEQEKDTNTSLPMTIRQNEMDEEEQEDQTNVIRSYQLWAMLFAVNATPTPNMKKLICFLYSIPASNAYVECVFSDMKHIY
ncbi:unnamed protein product [Rotaria magnacalcarata]|uniref:Uncharacterized protein n=1 Tax=Rotaria magnacalcarata TaxID=392030 RepID=A0A816XEU9_9BILA|nr:unnamed protein product [Rotaria magnacalcarata]